tara:strand:+ start:106 stop:486 length:381 start_codon:yes stop_codon:yes gene_type:complete
MFTKSIFAATAALSMSAGAALAGPYVNVESNASWSGDDYVGAITDIHVGFGGDLGEDASWYVQGGPAILAVDGAENETRYSGKVGVAADLTDSLGIYGELSALTASDSFEMDDLGLGGKLGATFSF